MGSMLQSDIFRIEKSDSLTNYELHKFNEAEYTKSLFDSSLECFELPKDLWPLLVVELEGRIS